MLTDDQLICCILTDSSKKKKKKINKLQQKYNLNVDFSKKKSTTQWCSTN
jgi:hypothetical protein